MDDGVAPETREARLRRPRRPRIDYASLPSYPEYDPLDYSNIARSCVTELLRQPFHTLPLEQAFWGAGVYAIFYSGDFPLYASYRCDPNDPQQPIYVGKADPAGARKGTRKRPQTPGEKLRSQLWGRLDEHARSIQAVESLRLDDFRCRYLVVKPIWIRMVERLLIEEARPAWNGGLEGFGLHDPGGDRSPIISWWDAMHPGRPAKLGWTAKIKYTRTQVDAELQLSRWLELPPEQRPVVVEDDLPPEAT